MQATDLLLSLIVLGLFSFYWSRGRSLALANPLGGIRNLHSLPSYYGLHAALWCTLPATFLLGIWLIFDEIVINGMVMTDLSPELIPSDNASYNLILNKVANIANGILPREDQPSGLLDAADNMLSLNVVSQWSITLLIITLAMSGLAWSSHKLKVDFRARPAVERVMQNLLLACACVAIFTTLGIVFSVLFESIQFFRSVPIYDFIF